VKFSAGRSELDSMIVEIELTLVSIIQGVAFTFLIENARRVMSIKQIVFWPYVAAGLLVILVFWSRSVLHIITLIRWPLEFRAQFSLHRLRALRATKRSPGLVCVRRDLFGDRMGALRL
jgi:fatty acid desaturase